MALSVKTFLLFTTAEKTKLKRFKFKVGDFVRVSGLKTVFMCEVNHKWSTELFKVNSLIK